MDATECLQQIDLQYLKEDEESTEFLSLERQQQLIRVRRQNEQL